MLDGNALGLPVTAPLCVNDIVACAEVLDDADGPVTLGVVVLPGVAVLETFVAGCDNAGDSEMPR